MLGCAMWLLGATRKVVEAGLVRGRSTEEVGPGSKVGLELLPEEKEDIPGERMSQRWCGSEDEQAGGCSEEWDVPTGQTLQRDHKETAY